MVTLAEAPSQSFDVFPDEKQLTDAIFAAFNKHSSTLFAIKDAHMAAVPEDERMPEMVARKERYSRDSKADYVDPSNMIVDFMAFYRDPDLRMADKLRLEPLKSELGKAIADEKTRNPASWSLPATRANMISLLNSNPVAAELFNETQIRR